MTPQEAAHFQVLRIIEQNPLVTQRMVAELMGLSVGKTNYLMKALVAKGAIKINSFKKSDTKLKKIAYLLTPAGISLRIHLTQSYLARMEARYVALKAEINALKQASVGPDTTRRQTPSEELIEVNDAERSKCADTRNSKVIASTFDQHETSIRPD